MIEINEMRLDSGVDWFEESREPEAENFHFSLITYGKCVYWVNERKIIMDKGDLILIPGQMRFYGKSIPTVFHSKYAMNFQKATGGPGLPILSGGDVIHFRVGCYELILERIKEMMKQWNERLPYYEVMSSALLTELLTYVNRELDRGEVASEKLRNVQMMKDYIGLHYRSKITKDDLGGVISKSPNYAITLFRMITGQTVSEYVHSLRIRTAKYMLTESRLNIGEIAEYLGYSDVSYFHRVFKRLSGNIPSDCR
ncbi:helix-turn-helix transcriptional regulator [Paenibacillus tarimensis]